MSKRILGQLSEAQKLHSDAIVRSNGGSFAYKLTAQSLSSHMDELNRIAVLEDERGVLEVIDFRLKAPIFSNGSVPLGILSRAAEEIRKIMGYAALRIVQGGVDRQRVPKHLYDDLDLRLAGVFQGSSKLIVTGAARRDLFDDGLNKATLERVFSILDTFGRGQLFLEATANIGPRSAKHLRELLKLLSENSAETEVSWKHNGRDVRNWIGTKQGIEDVKNALEVIEITEQSRSTLSGKIELLSKREKLDLRLPEGKLIRIFFPKRLLPKVSSFHLDQEVTLLCQLTEAANPLTNESRMFYELLEIFEQ